MYEHKHKPLISKKSFYKRLWKNFFLSALIMGFSILLGVAGYHVFGNLSLLDSFYNASMILTGMGPVDRLDTDAGKWFASFYALYSGIVFLTTIAVVLAPVVHRIMHKFHVQEKN